MILNFHTNSMPRMVPATDACKKLEVNILPWNWSVLVMKLQEEICFPFALLRRGSDGLLLEEQGITLNVAPVRTKNISFVNLSVGKIKPVSAGKCMVVAVACAGIATEPVKARRLFRFPTSCKVLHTCWPLHGSNCDTCTRHCQGFEN
jgi:hypothetical protein